jgi:hypothetical protein
MTTTTPGSDDLVAFLRARLDEDEEFAREATQAPWLCEDNFVENMDGGVIARFEIKANARHASWNDPARVLREIEVKRTILIEHSTVTEWNWPSQPDGSVPMEYVEALRRTLRHLAAVYDSHPDYRPQWAPNAG